MKAGVRGHTTPSFPLFIASFLLGCFTTLLVTLDHSSTTGHCPTTSAASATTTVATVPIQTPTPLVMMNVESSGLVSVPQQHSEENIHTTLKVLTLNIKNGAVCQHQLQKIASKIIDTGADLVALQEVDVGVSRSKQVDQPKELSNILGEPWNFLFVEAMPYQGGSYGNAVLSKLPLPKHALKLKLDSGSLNLGKETRAAVGIKVPSSLTATTPPGAPLLPLWFVSAHLGQTNEGSHQVDRLLDGVAKAVGDEMDNTLILLCGDFNVYNGGPRYESTMKQMARAGYTDCGPFEGSITFPTQLTKLDYVFAKVPSGVEFKVKQRVAVDCSNISDHNALLFEFEFWRTSTGTSTKRS